MAVTGLIGVGFVIGHMAGNLQMFLGPAKMNAYARVPEEHAASCSGWCAIGAARRGRSSTSWWRISSRRSSARRGRSATSSASRRSRRSPRARCGGAACCCSSSSSSTSCTSRPARSFRREPADAQYPSFSHTDVYGNVVERVPESGGSSLFYVVAMLFLGLHLYHGAWSSVRTLGCSEAVAQSAAAAASSHGRSLVVVLARLHRASRVGRASRRDPIDDHRTERADPGRPARPRSGTGTAST